MRQLALLHFRNTITLSVKLEDALARAHARVPPAIVQMLLVLQVGARPGSQRVGPHESAAGTLRRSLGGRESEAGGDRGVRQRRGLRRGLASAWPTGAQESDQDQSCPSGQGGLCTPHQSVTGAGGHLPPCPQWSHIADVDGFHLKRQLWAGDSCELLAATHPAARREQPAQGGI